MDEKTISDYYGDLQDIATYMLDESPNINKQSTMNHLFVPYEIALQLKEKGFDEPCIGIFHSKNLEFIWTQDMYPIENSGCGSFELTAPTYQQVVDWFREKHSLNISPQVCVEYPLDKELRKKGYGGNIYNHTTDTNLIGYFGETYYEALYKAIEEAIKLIK